MREGRRENGAGMGKETLPVLFALLIRSLLGGQGLSRSPCQAHPGLGQLRAPRKGAEGGGCSEELCSHVFSPKHPHASASPESPKGTQCPSQLVPPVLPGAAGEGGKGDGRPACARPGALHTRRAQPSASPSSPAGRGRCHGLARGGELAGLETRNYTVFGLGNVFLMSHIMFFKLHWNH